MFEPDLRDSLSLGPWRRRRTMRRLLAELDRADAAAARGRLPARARRAGDRRRKVAAFVVAVLVGASAAGVVAHEQFGVSVSRRGLFRPAPLGRPPVVATGVGTFRFMHTQPDSDRPVAYDPCEPLEYVVNDTLAPPGGGRLLHRAVRAVSAATGLHFVDTGRTTDLPRHETADSPPHGPALIAWTTPEVEPELAGPVAGIGGSTAVTSGQLGEWKYVTGMVALDAPQLRDMLGRQNGPAEVRAVILHELGHLVGLAHVDDRGELMYPDAGRLRLGPGDREGLAALGTGRCFP